jgi:hypothetical protein
MVSARSKAQKLKAKDYGFKPFQKMPGTQEKRFSKFHESLFSSKAWQGLTVYSKVLYIEISRKFNGLNEDNISITYDEGGKLMNKKTFTKSLDQLIEHGFIRIVEHNPHNAKCNIYALHTAWHQYGTEGFKVVKRASRKLKQQG